MTSSYREDASRKGLIILILCIGIIAIAWFLTVPKYNKWRELKQQLTLAKISFASKQKIVEARKRLVLNYQARKSELAVLEETLPNAPKVPQLLSNVESLVIASGMRLNNISVTDPTLIDTAAVPVAVAVVAEGSIARPQLVQLKIELSVEGDVGNFRNLLRLIENNIRLFDVNSLSIASNNEQGPPGQSVYNLVLGTHYQK